MILQGRLASYFMQTCFTLTTFRVNKKKQTFKAQKHFFLRVRSTAETEICGIFKGLVLKLVLTIKKLVLKFDFKVKYMHRECFIDF